MRKIVEALYDQAGRVYAWLDTATGRIHGRRGENLAFLDGNSIYDWRGRHIAWWQDGHIRDRQGYAALFTANATNLGVVRPVRAVSPIRPVKAVAPVRPIKQAKPVRPVKRLAWSTKLPF